MLRRPVTSPADESERASGGADGTLAADSPSGSGPAAFGTLSLHEANADAPKAGVPGALSAPQPASASLETYDGAFPTPMAPPAVSSAWVPAAQLSRASALQAERGLATGGYKAQRVRAELLRCSSLQQLQEAVDRLGALRPLDAALAVAVAGQLVRREAQNLLPGETRSQHFFRLHALRKVARKLAEQCTWEALAGRTEMEGLQMLLRGWSLMRRRPPRDQLAQIMEALAPGAWSEAAEPQQHRTRAHNAPAPVRYGRLHMATLADIASLAPVLSELDVLNHQLRHIMGNVAVRRARYEAPADLAAAATAFCRVGLADPRVAAALLGAVLQQASCAGAAQVAQVLRLCSKAGYYERDAYAAAAELLLSRGVGELGLGEVAAVVRAFAAGRHMHGMLLDALAVRAGALARDVAAAPPLAPPAPEQWSERPDGSEQDGANGDVRTVSSDGGAGDGGDGGGLVLDGEQDLYRVLNAVAALAHGFRALQCGHEQLFAQLEAAAVRLLHDAAVQAAAAAGTQVRTPHGIGFSRMSSAAAADADADVAVDGVGLTRLRPSRPRVVAAALVALVEGLAGDSGCCSAGLLRPLQTWLPSLAPALSPPELATLTGALADLRLRDPLLLAALDGRAAQLLASQLRSSGGDNRPQQRGKTATADSSGDAALASPPSPATALSWLPSFLDSAARRLAYPCSRTLEILLQEPEPVALGRVRASRTGESPTSSGSDRDRRRRRPRATPLQRLLAGSSPCSAPEGDGSGRVTRQVTPQAVCVLAGALACAGALSDEATVRALTGALGNAVAARLQEDSAAGTHSVQNAAELLGGDTEGAACHLFRAFLAARDAGLEQAFRDGLPPKLAQPLLSRAADAWHAAELGNAVPRTLRLAAAARRTPLQRLRLRGGGGAPPSARLLPESLAALGLPFFGECETPDGHFRLAQGVGVSGRIVGVEVLPDSAFALAGEAGRPGRPPRAAKESGPVAGPVLVGDAAFRARCLAACGWQLLALPESTWRAAEAAGPGACAILLDRLLSPLVATMEVGDP